MDLVYFSRDCVCADVHDRLTTCTAVLYGWNHFSRRRTPVSVEDHLLQNNRQYCFLFCFEIIAHFLFYVEFSEKGKCFFFYLWHNLSCLTLIWFYFMLHLMFVWFCNDMIIMMVSIT